MKKFSKLTPEQYDALKKHLVLITRNDLPADDTYPYSSHHFPCFRFEPGELAEKDDSLESVILLGRRNPWNCAQLIASMMPQVLDYLPEEPWYKELAKAAWSGIRKFGRNWLALNKRVLRAIRHRDEEELLTSIIRLTNETVWSLCWLLAAVCFVAGFVKPHCFVTAIFFVILAALWRTMNVDEENDRRA